MTTDAQAELVLAYIALPVARHLRDGDTKAAWDLLANTRVDQVRQACVLLAAMVDPDLPRQRLLGWWEGGRPAGPEHADEWTDAPPLLVEARHG